MIDGATIVLDVGKTHAKLSLCDERGHIIDRHVRANAVGHGSPFRSLDVAGIDAWLIDSLAACASAARVRRIIPVAHGAAAAVIRDGRLHIAPIDYEQPTSDAQRQAYARERDPFRATGSPLLPNALNLGMQLDLLETFDGALPSDSTILLWPQYWAWRLSGVAASEVTSLGCHTDLWRPVERRFTDLAINRGWAARLAPMRHAGETLGTITSAIVAATALPADCEVLCGLHDSNAALLAARGYRAISDHDVTVLSTGTWFVAMRSLASSAEFDTRALPEQRDCLVNVDIRGLPVPSARFMGGREAELIRGRENAVPFAALRRGLPDLLARNGGAFPSLVAGVGPFPDSRGSLDNVGDEASERQSVASLYLAMMTDTILSLLESRCSLLVEGRFADDELLVRALARLRPDQSVLTASGTDELAFGALRLVAPNLDAPTELSSVEPLDIDLRVFAENWRKRAGRSEPMDERSALTEGETIGQ